MYEIIWQYDENAPYLKSRPSNPAESLAQLMAGNKEFAEFFAPHLKSTEPTRKVIQVSPSDVGISDQPGQIPKQEPFAAFISCADARVPVEFIFSRRANELFVVRVAGNVLGDEGIGSIDYAIETLGTIRMVGVLGHTGCGAVTAAVDTYLYPENYLGVALNFPLQSIISKLMGPVRGASQALSATHGQGIKELPGYRQALIETAALTNAALAADVLINTFQHRLGDQIRIAFSIYNLTHRSVGLPGFGDDSEEWQPGLFDPPANQADFVLFTKQVADSKFIRKILFEGSSSGQA